jgi:hypothetical protein
MMERDTGGGEQRQRLEGKSECGGGGWQQWQGWQQWRGSLLFLWKHKNSGVLWLVGEGGGGRRQGGKPFFPSGTVHIPRN